MKILAIVLITIGLPLLLTSILFYSQNFPNSRPLAIAGMALLTAGISLITLSAMREDKKKSDF